MKVDVLPCAMKMATSQLKTPIGVFEIEACETGLHKIQYKGSDVAVDSSKNEDSTGPVKAALRWLDEYFVQANKNLTSLEPPICWDGIKKTDFEMQVWKGALDHVKFGQTMAYGDLAKAIDRSGATRAVGTALKKNPIVLLIPCHRIIRNDGTFGNYSAGGSSNKDWLLKFEKAN